MTAKLRSETIERVVAMWSELAGLRDAGSAVIVNATSRICPPGWGGIVQVGEIWIGTAPSAIDLSTVRLLVQNLANDDDWEPTLSSNRAIAETRGPAFLAYLDRRANSPEPSDIALGIGDLDELGPLLGASDETDQLESGIESCTHLSFARSGGTVVGAAGFRLWESVVAHMSVLVATNARGRGIATAVAAHATDRAIAAGYTPQWRARPTASRAVAAKLGYIEIGRQVSFRLTPTS